MIHPIHPTSDGGGSRLIAEARCGGSCEREPPQSAAGCQLAGATEAGRDRPWFARFASVAATRVDDEKQVVSDAAPRTRWIKHAPQPLLFAGLRSQRASAYDWLWQRQHRRRDGLADTRCAPAGRRAAHVLRAVTDDGVQAALVDGRGQLDGGDPPISLPVGRREAWRCRRPG